MFPGKNWKAAVSSNKLLHVPSRLLVLWVLRLFNILIPEVFSLSRPPSSRFLGTASAVPGDSRTATPHPLECLNVRPALSSRRGFHYVIMHGGHSAWFPTTIYSVLHTHTPETYAMIRFWATGKSSETWGSDLGRGGLRKLSETYFANRNASN